MPGPTTQAHSNAPLRLVKKVQFGVLSPEEIVSIHGGMFTAPLVVREPIIVLSFMYLRIATLAVLIASFNVD